MSSTSEEPESPRFPEEWLSDELLDARAEPEPPSPLTPALALGTGGIRVLQRSRRAVKLVVTHLPPKHFSNSRHAVFHDRESDQSPDRQRPGLIDDIFSVSSDACSVPSGWSSGRVVGSRWNATPSDWCETFRPLSQSPKREAAQPSFQT